MIKKHINKYVGEITCILKNLLKKKEKDARIFLSIRFRFLAGILAMVVFFVAMSVSLNTTFLKIYYTRQKENTLMETFDAISSMNFEDQQWTEAYLKTVEEQKGLQILIFSDYNPADNTVSMYYPYGENPMLSVFAPTDDDLWSGWSLNEWIINDQNQSRFDMFSSQPSDLNLSSRYSSQLSTEYLSLYGKTKAGYNMVKTQFYIIINTSVVAVDEGVSIANRFALIVGAFTLLIGGMIGTAFCIGLTKPILQISRTTRKMAQLHFTDKVNVKSRDELGALALDINYLSGQLEQKINELSEANHQLLIDIKEKEKIDDMRRNFISSISHDLRTPLSIILGYCEGLQSSQMNAEDREYYCGVIEEEALHMSALTKRLLALAELESGGENVEKSCFDLGEAASSRIQKIGYLAQERSIKTSCECQPYCVVDADIFRIEEVLNNLLQNAINHTPDGGEISVNVAKESIDGDNDEYIICRIYNSGSRVPEESLPYIWESFYRVDRARTRQYGGAGLGLKIVSAIMDMHGGRYGAENCDDGVTFWFALKSV